MFFLEIGRKGGAALKKQADPDYYSRIGKLGGSAPRRKRRTATPSEDA
jgi:general stress protein YciG